jgi:hypothetical protein
MRKPGLPRKNRRMKSAMFRSRARLICIGLTIMFGSSVGLSAPATANATSGPVATTDRYKCGSYCDGKSPNTLFWDDYNHVYYRCSDDADTIYYVPAATNHPKVELRYSWKCQTAWARVPYAVEGYSMKVDSFYSSTGPRRLSYTSGTSRWGASWTPMVNDAYPYVARACIWIPYGSYKCTGKF